METIFLIALGVIFYTYLGYGILIYSLNLFKSSKGLKIQSKVPKATLLIAAYNEEEIIEDKIKNSLNIEYPGYRLQIAFVTDGSTDRTPDIIKRYPEVKLFHKDERKGKIHAINRVMPFIDSEITIFSDANVMLNSEAALLLTSHFTDDNVAAVSGEKVVRHETKDQSSSAGEGIYWKYESFLKKMDSKFNTMVGSAGELYAIRTSFYEKIDPGTLIEDFVMTMNFAKNGYKVAYEAEAKAIEYASVNMKEELKRKVRIAAGGLQAIIRLLPLLNFFRFGKLSFQYISHRVLRWTLTPLCIPIAFVSNLFLLEIPIYKLTFLLQCLFYAIVFVGYINRNKKKNKYLSIPYYFIFMNQCVVKGWIEYLSNTQSVTWDKAKRIVPEV